MAQKNRRGPKPMPRQKALDIILDRLNGHTHQEIANRNLVSSGTVAAILTGQRVYAREALAQLSPQQREQLEQQQFIRRKAAKSKLSPKQVAAIWRGHKAGVTVSQIAKQLGIKYNDAWQVATGRTWCWLTSNLEEVEAGKI